MKVFLDKNGHFYLAKSAKTPGDAEKPFMSSEAIAALEKASRPVTIDELSEYIKLVKDRPELLKNVSK